MTETADERIERVARALCASNEADWDAICEAEPFPRGWDGSLVTREDYRKDARAADAISFAAGVEAAAQLTDVLAKDADANGDLEYAEHLERHAARQRALTARRPGDPT